MKADSKLRKISCARSELARLKLLWRDSLPETERDYWREQFASPRSQAELRQELQSRYGIQLAHDTQLTRFRTWVRGLDDMEQEKQRAAAEEEELKKQGLTGEKLRSELLCRMKARALARGDFKLGLKAITADVKVETLQLHREKFLAAQHALIEVGLDAVAAAFKAHPQAMESYQKAYALVSAKNN